MSEPVPLSKKNPLLSLLVSPEEEAQMVTRLARPVSLGLQVGEANGLLHPVWAAKGISYESWCGEVLLSTHWMTWAQWDQPVRARQHCSQCEGQERFRRPPRPLTGASTAEENE